MCIQSWLAPLCPHPDWADGATSIWIILEEPWEDLALQLNAFFNNEWPQQLT